MRRRPRGSLALGTALLVAAGESCRRPTEAGDGTSAQESGQEAASNEAGNRERAEMITEQLAARGISDPAVLAAMGAVPRHRFVPSDLASQAYRDRPLPIGYGQTISQPYVVAFMTEAAGVEPGDRVLEVGTGSGYQAAVLAEIVGELWTIEISEPLAARAERDLSAAGYEQVHVRAGDGYRGWPEEAPFDTILVTAAPDHVPEPLLEQLAEGGTLVIPVGSQGFAGQEILRITRTADGYARESLLPVRFVPMTGEAEER
jgi:protein-L-isoaspartate(D-aspartate) O-methyltransferase